MQWPAVRTIGMCIMLVGIGPYIYARYRVRSHNWRPLTTPVVLKPGEFQSPEFTTDLNGRYLILLSFDQLQGADLQRAQCLLGISLPKAVLNCSGAHETFEFDWDLISENGEMTQSGSYKPLSFSGAETVFADFQGKRGASQRIVLKVRREAAELNAAHPKLVVQVGPEHWEKLADMQSYSLLWAKTIGVLGLLLVLVPSLAWVAKKLW